MEHFAGIDLHSSNSYIAIIDNENRRVFKKKVRNDLQNNTHNVKIFFLCKPNNSFWDSFGTANKKP